MRAAPTPPPSASGQRSRADLLTVCARAAHHAERLIRRVRGEHGGPTWARLGEAERSRWLLFVEAALRSDPITRDDPFATIARTTGAALGLAVTAPNGIAAIVAATAARLGVSTAAMRVRRRDSQAVMDARHLAMLLASDAGYSSVTIGRALARHHTTVLADVERMRAEVKRRGPLRAAWRALRDELGLAVGAPRAA